MTYRPSPLRALADQHTRQAVAELRARIDHRAKTLGRVRNLHRANVRLDHHNVLELVQLDHEDRPQAIVAVRGVIDFVRPSELPERLVAKMHVRARQLLERHAPIEGNPEIVVGQGVAGIVARYGATSPPPG